MYGFMEWAIIIVCGVIGIAALAADHIGLIYSW